MTTVDFTPTPGVYPDLDNEIYHSSGGVSKSHLDTIAPECGGTPLHYWARYVDPDREPRKRTAAMIEGDAIHKAVLQPELMESSFLVAPDDAPRRPSERQINAKKPSFETLDAIAWWDDFNARAAGKTMLSAEDYDMVMGCRDAVHRHPVAGPLLSGGRAETSYYAIDPETGTLIKCRLDYRKGNMIIDLKSTLDASPEGFGKSASTYRYDVQSVWYPDVVKLATGEDTTHFIFVAVEKSPPHAIGVYYMPEQIDDGWTDDTGAWRERLRPCAVQARQAARRNLNDILECRRTGVWPDWTADRPRPLELPRWTKRAV